MSYQCGKVTMSRPSPKAFPYVLPKGFETARCNRRCVASSNLTLVWLSSHVTLRFLPLLATFFCPDSEVRAGCKRRGDLSRAVSQSRCRVLCDDPIFFQSYSIAPAFFKTETVRSRTDVVGNLAHMIPLDSPLM